MKKLLAILAVVFLVAGCRPSSGSGGEKVADYIYYIHDSEHGVGIWQGENGSISVLPDNEYKH